MKIFRVPGDLRAIIFDIDSTLYTHAEYAHEQVDVQIRHFARLRGMEEGEARRAIESYREKVKEDTGATVSLGNALVSFGVPIEESVRWRENLIEPARYLSRDERLVRAIEGLSSLYELVAVTNNPVLPARKTLDVLGVTAFFPTLIGLDTCGVSKPHELPFLTASRAAGVPVESCLSVGDRYDIDIALPLSMGMGGILVDGVEDVYLLGDILKTTSSR